MGLLHHCYAFFFIYLDETIFISEKLGKKSLLPGKSCDVTLVSEMLGKKKTETGTKECLATNSKSQQ